MQKTEREREILNKLKSKDGFVSASELSRELYASESSIRRDLVSLERRGLIKRTHGGCELAMNHSGAISFSARFGHNVEAKRIIAAKAASLIKDGEVIFLDQSSTAYYLAEEIRRNSTLTIVTNNLEILTLLSASDMRVISSGGMLCEGNRACLVGSDAEKTFEGIFADLVFFSTKSVSEDGVLSDTISEEVSVRRAMLENARKKIYLCDESKLYSQSAFKQCRLSDIDTVVSDGKGIASFVGTPEII